MFANASPERKAVYFSIIGEPPIKMLRYQQQYTFFDAAKLGDGTIRFIHLGQQALDGGMAKVLKRSCRRSRSPLRESSSWTPFERWCEAL
jgi:circadian clock protein KaiC